MNLDAQNENARTLAAALGLSEEGALDFLAAKVVITHDPADMASDCFARHVIRMLSRTITQVEFLGESELTGVDVELVVGMVKPRLTATHIFVTFGVDEVLIDSSPSPFPSSAMRPISLLLGACYATGAVLAKIFNEVHFQSGTPIKIGLKGLLGDDLKLLDKPLAFGEAYLAGAGAIGNGFIYGLSQFKVEGVLHVVDDDAVSGGNLQRCVYFDDGQIGLPKCDCLCDAMAKSLSHVIARPFKGRLQHVPERKAGPWLERLVVGVDSPRARRSLQSEIPREVFDASTTGISEIAFHFNKQPADLACMSCAYHESPEEFAHEKHVAEVLGVSLEDVRSERISAASAKTIHDKMPNLLPSELEGLAYDTLFKRLCSTGNLTTPEGKQVLAPFCFISVMAGTYLAIEFVRRIQNPHASLFNEWYISPWSNPVLRRRRISPKRIDCEFCGNEMISQVAKRTWVCG